MKKSIFIIDDEIDMIRIASDLLFADGYVVDSAANPVQGLKKIRTNLPDLLLLDLRLPDMDGYQVCKEMKADLKTRHVPIIMISAKSDETDVVVGLEMGADDYIVKPFRQKELLARVKTVLRRKTEEDVPRNKTMGPLSLDCCGYIASLNNRPLNLTPKEFELLDYFVTREGRVLTRAKIYESVWGVNFAGSSRTIDAHVDQLRKKLGKKKEWISTLKGVGYRFQSGG